MGLPQLAFKQIHPTEPISNKVFVYCPTAVWGGPGIRQAGWTALTSGWFGIWFCPKLLILGPTPSGFNPTRPACPTLATLFGIGCWLKSTFPATSPTTGAACSAPLAMSAAASPYSIGILE